MKTEETFAELLRFNVGYIGKLVEGLAPEAYFIRPENRGNPLIWILGHIVLNRGEIIEILGGDPRTGDLGDLFARGTRPENNPSHYPDPAQLIARFAKMSGVTDSFLLRSNGEILERPSWGQFKSTGHNLAYSYMHETHHIGQMTYIANLPSVKSLRKSSTVYGRHEKKNSTGKIILDSLKSAFS